MGKYKTFQSELAKTEGSIKKLRAKQKAQNKIDKKVKAPGMIQD